LGLNLKPGKVEAGSRGPQWPMTNPPAGGHCHGGWQVHNAQPSSYQIEGQVPAWISHVGLAAIEAEVEASSSGARRLKLSEHLSPSISFGPPPGLEDSLPAPTAPTAPLPTLLPSNSSNSKARRKRDRNFEDNSNLSMLLRTQDGAAMLSAQLATLDGVMLQTFCSGLVTSMLPDIKNLACDPHAMPIISKLLTLPIDDLKVKLIRRLRGSLLKLTKDKYGCWIVQEALQAAPQELLAPLVLELRGNVMTCCRHRHGNFVLQRVVELVGHDRVGFIVDEMKDHAVDAALHVYSCRVLQRLVEHCPPAGNMAGLLDNLLQQETLHTLATDAYGNNALRAVLSFGKPEHIKKIAWLMSGNVLKYSQNRHASLVVEKCLESLSEPGMEEERIDFMTAILGQDSPNPPFAKMALDRYGNYIAQRVMESCQGTEQQRILDLLGALRPKLRHAVNGQHILQAAQRKFGTRLSEPASYPHGLDAAIMQVHECTEESIILAL